MPDRILLKREAKDILKSARVSPYLFTLIALVISLVISSVSEYIQWDTAARAAYEKMFGLDLSFIPLCHAPFPHTITLFVTIVCTLLSVILAAGELLYHLGIHRGEEKSFETLFDGFYFAGKLILLYIVRTLFITLWSMLFVIPGLVAAYRYRFAMYNLCENPEMGVMEALNMSKAQTYGFKGQLFLLDLSFIGWSILSTMTLGILSIWLSPYMVQTNIGYFQEIKQIKGIGFFPGQSADHGPAL